MDIEVVVSCATNQGVDGKTTCIGFRSDVDVCDDGPTTGPASPTHQSTTSYTIGGQYLDPNNLTYFVVPGGTTLKKMKAEGLQLGDLGIATYTDQSGKIQRTIGIVGETGPADKTGELSVKGVKELGLPIGTNTKGQIIGGGVDANVVNYYFFPGSKSTLESITGVGVMPTQRQMTQALEKYAANQFSANSFNSNEFKLLKNLFNSTPLIQKLD